MMSKVYAWQKYEDAEKAGLFENHETFWLYIFGKTRKPIPYHRNEEEFHLVASSEDECLIKILEDEPAPDLELLEGGIMK